MPRFDLHPMPGREAGYVVNVQADLLADLATRIVVPLLPAALAPRPILELNPALDIAGQPHVLLTQAIVSLPARDLEPAIASLAAHRDRITRALDILLTGF